MSKVGTLIYVFDDRKILLGSKKYGKAKGKLNGFGGKVETTDGTIKDAAIRELEEETSLKVSNIKLHGVLNMSWGQEQGAEIYLFRAYGLKSKARESNEMTVEWFDVDRIPKKRMWESDKYWFDLVLQDRKFIANLIFDDTDSDLLKKMSVEFVDNTEQILKEV